MELDETKPTANHAPKVENRLRTLDPFVVAAIRLLILTGARLREILHARWEHVDFERGLLLLPDSKTGKKPVYLSGAALTILSTLPRIAGNPHIIPGEQDDAPRADLKRPWAAVTKAAGLDGVRLHDLPHSFASIGAGASMGLPIIGFSVVRRRRQRIVMRTLTPIRNCGNREGIQRRRAVETTDDDDDALRFDFQSGPQVIAVDPEVNIVLGPPDPLRHQDSVIAPVIPFLHAFGLLGLFER